MSKLQLKFIVWHYGNFHDLIYKYFSYVSALEKEKQENNFRKSIELANKDELKHVQTNEKNVLPDPSGT